MAKVVYDQRGKIPNYVLELCEVTGFHQLRYQPTNTVLIISKEKPDMKTLRAKMRELAELVNRGRN